MAIALVGCGGGSEATPASSSHQPAVTVGGTNASNSTIKQPENTQVIPDATSSVDQIPLSFYIGNDPARLAVVSAWLGREPDAIQLHVGRASWSDWNSSSGWLAGLFGNRGIDLRWSVPLIPVGADLAQAAAGTYDDHYRKQARTLVAATPQGQDIYVRLGWEFNGDWQPWSAIGKAESYRQAFQRAVTVFRSESGRFEFEWTPNIGDQGMNPSLAYPGDAYVDVIGMDFYYDTAYYSSDPEAAWSQMVDQTYGLAWHQDFAAQHGKPTAYAEWGVNSNNAGAFIANARNWFADYDVVYHNYWDSNADFQGMLSDNQYPAASAAFVDAFGD
jgi:hypothetical protein